MPRQRSKDGRSFEEKFGNVVGKAQERPVPAAQRPQAAGKAGRPAKRPTEAVKPAVRPAAAPPVGPPTLAERIKGAHGRFLAGLRTTLEAAREAGDLLILAKKEAGHGNWLPWLEEANLGFSEDTAQRYMRLAAGWDRVANTAAVRYLDLTAALALLTDKEANTAAVRYLPDQPPTPRIAMKPRKQAKSPPVAPVPAQPPVALPPPGPAQEAQLEEAASPQAAPPSCPRCGFSLGKDSALSP